MRLTSFVSALSVGLVLMACGGGGVSTIESPTFAISWAGKSRAPISGPASANSARITFPGAGANGTDLVVNVDRNSDPAAYTGTYNVGSPIPGDSKNFSAQFFAGAGQTGPIVATATATITWQGSSADLGNIAVDGKVASVQVVDPGPVSEVDPPFDLQFIAKDSAGASLALSPGSATWSVLVGATSMTVAPDGRATPLLPGTTAVKATVDGIASPNRDVEISKVEITYTELDSSSAPTVIYGGGNAVQVGSINDLPAMWTGTAGSRVDLAPPGAIAGQVYGADGGQQSGGVQFASDNRYHAGLWSGTAASFVDLHPAGATYSSASCLVGSRQGGAATFTIPGSSELHPGIWSGSASSWVSLLPAGSKDGRVNAMTSTRECGYVVEIGATLWSGSAESVVSLHPAGATGSVANAMNDLYQVGSASFGQIGHAFAWQGSAASAIDLHPASASRSEGKTVVDHYAGGEIDQTAAIWNIETKAFIKLTDFIPNGFTRSTIYSCDRTSTGYVFFGYVSTTLFTSTHAAIWHVPFRRMPQ